MWWHTLILAMVGLTGVAVGGYLLFAPVGFRAQYGIALGSDPNELSETRAPGGVRYINHQNADVFQHVLYCSKRLLNILMNER
jgi:hypothetical protein